MTAASLRGKPRAASHRPLGPNFDAVGLAGEQAFAARYGYEVDYEYSQRGDGGGDFATLIGSVDVKTYRKPAHLLVERGKVRADFYVLARYVDATLYDARAASGYATAQLLGWASAAEVLDYTPADVGGMGVQSHAMPASRLRGLDALDRLLGAWCVGCGRRVVIPLETRPLRGGARPADFATVCIVCVHAGWALVQPGATALAEALRGAAPHRPATARRSGRRYRCG